MNLRDPRDARRALLRLCLKDAALSGSGTSVRGAHIIDPRTGQPVRDKLRVWARAPLAAHADALSTAFMVLSVEELGGLCNTGHYSTCGIYKKYVKKGVKLPLHEYKKNYVLPTV